mmetsp:Transcript_11919/g.44335  ORF Transcript_11919/g.44335 Transcript_11919/m.44335 type:complete len:279 (-) Transcript_11919:746-1582(-)
MSPATNFSFTTEPDFISASTSASTSSVSVKPSIWRELSLSSLISTACFFSWSRYHIHAAGGVGFGGSGRWEASERLGFSPSGLGLSPSPWNRIENAPRRHLGNKPPFDAPFSSRSSSMPLNVPSTRTQTPFFEMSYVSLGAYALTTGPNTLDPNSQRICMVMSGTCFNANTIFCVFRKVSLLSLASFFKTSFRTKPLFCARVASWTRLHPSAFRVSIGKSHTWSSNSKSSAAPFPANTATCATVFPHASSFVSDGWWASGSRSLGSLVLLVSFDAQPS